MKGFAIFAVGVLIGLLVASAIAAAWISASVIGPGPSSLAPIVGAADVTVRLGDDYLSRQINRRLDGAATATVRSAPGGQVSIDLRVAARAGPFDLSAGMKSRARATTVGGRVTVELIEVEVGSLHLDPARLPAAVTGPIAGANAALAQHLNAEASGHELLISGVQTDQTGITLLLKARE